MSVIFQKSLHDLVKGIRANKKNEKQYITDCIAEIKVELRNVDLTKKAVAIQKLTYLHMLGYDMNWAAFHVIEVISSENFKHKRIGYLAASQSFTPQTDVIMLATNLFKKDFVVSEPFENGLALNALSNICTEDLSRDLVSDIMTMLNSSRAYVRKKGVLVMYKIFLKYPEALRPSFPRVKEKLEDPDQSVVAGAVNVICELARKNPKNYLALAPIFYKLLTTLTNNWTLIKIVKLFAALAPLEPRLGKKLAEPMANIINTTPAKSLLYECLFTVTIGMHQNTTLLRLAIDKLKTFVEDPDQNLKYMGLLGLVNVLKVNPRMLVDLRETLQNCLGGEDITIRLRALELLTGMVTKKTLIDTCEKLIEQAERTNEDQYRDQVVEKIILACSEENYKHVVDFEWYISMLIRLTTMKGLSHGKLLSSQLMDVLIRVPAMREYGIKALEPLLSSAHFISETAEGSDKFEVLYAAAYLTGEFVSCLDNPVAALESLLQPSIVSLPPTIQAAYIQSVLKIYSYLACNPDKLEELNHELNDEGSDSRLGGLREQVRKGFQPFLKSSDVEVQERAYHCMRMLDLHAEMLESGMDISQQLHSLFEEELNPVAKKAQKKVPLPDGLDLDEWINAPIPETESHFSFDNTDNISELSFGNTGITSPTRTPEEIFEENQRRSQQELARRNNAWYLPSGGKSVSPDIVPIELPEDIKVDKRKSKKGKTKKSHHRPKNVQVLSVVDAPADAKSDSDHDQQDDISKRLNVDLFKPLEATETLPTIQAYKQITPEQEIARLAKEAKARHEERKLRRKEKHGDEKKSSKHSSSKHRKSSTSGDKDKKEERRRRKSSSAEPVQTKTSSSKSKSSEVQLIDLFGDSNNNNNNNNTTTNTNNNSNKISSPKVNSPVLTSSSSVNNNVTVSAVPTQVETPYYITPSTKSKEKSESKSESKSKDKSEKKRRSSKKSEEQSDRKHKSSHKHKSESSKDKDKDHKHKSHKSSKEASSDILGLLSESKTGNNFGAKPNTHLLFQDENLTVAIPSNISPFDSNNITIPLHLQNIGGQDITSISYNVVDTMNTHLVRPTVANAKAPIMVPFVLPASQSNVLNVHLTFNSLTRHQLIPFVINYNTMRGAAKEVRFELGLPCSVFLKPIGIGPAEFVSLAQSPQCCHLSSGRIQLATSQTPRTLQVTLNQIAALLRLRIVEVMDSSASLYGRSVQNHHVLVLVKVKTTNDLLIEIKSNDEVLSSSLLNEAHKYFK